ncbi:MAG: SCO family protein [Gammaproteobacteria bacterium]|nr:SCO family protein [Gammaproteobacteria bacterium]MCI0590450.1 SCO family protein [Gammaproteobacteria bacterium]
MVSRRSITVATVAGGLVALGMGLGVFLSVQGIIPRGADAQRIEGLLWPNPKRVEAFTLIDQNGAVFDLESLKGKWSFVFFGYTHCPDVCPVTLTVFNAVHDKLAEHPSLSDDYQFIFVSVDPERDTPDKLRSYVSYFNKTFIGLGGTEQQVASLTGQLGVLHVRTEANGSQDYLVDHTASVFLIDPLARLVAIFSQPQEAEQMASRYVDIRHFVEANI